MKCKSCPCPLQSVVLAVHQLPAKVTAIREETTAASERLDKHASIVCYLYNHMESGYNYEKQGHCKKLHACSTCAVKVFFNKHPAFECNK